MAITSKLSRRLYETLGDEAADEMVNWMQRVDAQRAELRELNQANFARFDVRLGERTAELEVRFGDVAAGLADVRREMETGFARLEIKIEQRTADIMKWSFVFWVGSVVTLVGALAALARFYP